MRRTQQQRRTDHGRGPSGAAAATLALIVALQAGAVLLPPADAADTDHAKEAWASPLGPSTTPEQGPAGASTTIAVGNEPWGVTFHPWLPRAYVANIGEHSVSVLDTVTWTVVATHPVGLLPAYVAVHPWTGLVYVTLLGDAAVAVLEPVSGLPLRTVDTLPRPLGIAFDATDGRYHLTHQMAQGLASVHDGLTDRRVAEAEVGAYPIGIAVDGSQRQVVVADYDIGRSAPGTLTILDADTYAVTSQVEVPRGPVWVAFDAAGAELWVSSLQGEALTVLDATTHAPRASLALPGGPAGFALHEAQGSQVVVVALNDADTLAVVDAATMGLVRTHAVGDRPIHVAGTPAAAPVVVTLHNDAAVAVLEP